MLAKLLFALFLIYEAQCFKYFNTYSENHDIDKAEEMFKEFLEATEMVFTGDEYHERLAVFTENIKVVNKLNSRNGSAQFGITIWSHLTPEEFKERNRCIPEEKGTTATKEFITDMSDDDDDDRDVPSSKDWRDKLPPVKNQLRCFTCWIFSGIGAIEAQYAIVNNEVVSLSEQQVQDCTSECLEAGFPHEAFKYVKEFGGIMAEKDYPYISADEKCHANVSKVVARVTSYAHYMNEWSEKKMREYVGTTGPLSIGIDATMLSNYIGGILDPREGECKGEIDHAVLITGYSDVEKEHWVIRDSSSELFGEKGYFRIVRNKRACSIGDYVATVTVAKN